MITEIINYIKDQLLHNDFFSGAAIATILGSLLYQLKAVPSFILNRVERLITYRITVYQQTELFDAIEDYFKKNYAHKYRNVEAILGEDDISIGDSPSKIESGAKSNDSKKYNSKIRLIHHDDIFVIWKNKTPIYVSKGREKLENASSLRAAFLISFTFRSMFGKRIINGLMDEIIDLYNKSRNVKVTTDIFVNNYHSWHKSREFNKSLDNVILPIDVKNAIKEDLAEFSNVEEKYKSLDIPYKRGYLFYGPPGNGKTSLITALAGDLKMNICYLSLSSVDSDSYLRDLFSNIPDNSILAMEDIDAIFNKRKSKSKITFSALLNCLDGIFYKEKLITIITTNHFDSLDPALIRPGRMDVKIEIKNPTKESVEEYLSLFYEESVLLDNYSEIFSMAEIVGFCIKNDKIGCLSEISEKKLKIAN